MLGFLGLVFFGFRVFFGFIRFIGFRGFWGFRVRVFWGLGCLRFRVFRVHFFSISAF